MGDDHYLLPGCLYLFLSVLSGHRMVAGEFPVVVRRLRRGQERCHRRLPAGEGVVPLRVSGHGLYVGIPPGLLVFFCNRPQDSTNSRVNETRRMQCVPCNGLVKVAPLVFSLERFCA